MSLADLEARIAHDLTTLNIGAADWVAPRSHPDGHVYDVVIVGGALDHPRAMLEQFAIASDEFGARHELLPSIET